MMNLIVLIGRLTRDPELRYTPQGVAVTRFSLAVNRPFTNAQGEREADFIDCVAWRKLGETVANHLQKGRLVGVRGRLQIRSWEGQDGQRRRSAEVVVEDVHFLDRARESGGASAAGTGTGGGGDYRGPSDPFGDFPMEDTGDDVPF